MQSPCISRMAPAVAMVSEMLKDDPSLCNEAFTGIVQQCGTDPGDVPRAAQDAAQHKIDEKVLCELMCCCTNNPNTGGDAKTDQKQGCVSATLKAADTALNNQGRYKPEISYNMDIDPPEPFMHRDEYGQDTLQKSERWQTRALQAIPGYRGGQGDVRRPDVIIVKDPAKPPYQDNIDRVVEMKFKGDVLGKKQEEAYEDIAGGRDKLKIMREGKDCNCSGDDGEEQLLEQFAATPAAQERDEQSIDWGAVGETAGMAVVTALGAIATAALVLSPFEGPAGEIAAGTGTAAAAARTAAAFGRIF